MVDSGGRSWLIDPAAHGGHREFGLAMMRLFGGFGEAAFADVRHDWLKREATMRNHLTAVGTR